MTHGDPLGAALPGPDEAFAEVVASAQTLTVGTEWVVAGHVRVRRRVVTERRTIEVDVRREIVEIEGDDVDFDHGRLFGTALDGPPVAGPSSVPAPFVAVLREEVPRVELDVRAYERLTVTTIRVQDAATVHTAVSREEIDVASLRVQP